MCDLTDPIFIDADKAREHLEALYWPNGPVCRHCGNADASPHHVAFGQEHSPRHVGGCNACRQAVHRYGRNHNEVVDNKIPLNKLGPRLPPHDALLPRRA